MPDAAPDAAPAAGRTGNDAFEALLLRLFELPTGEAAEFLGSQDDGTAVRLLLAVNQVTARDWLAALPKARRDALTAAAPAAYREQWLRNETYPEGTVGRLMRPPVGVLPDSMPARLAVEELRRLVPNAQVTYLYAVDRDGRLDGVVVLRDLFLASPQVLLRDIMVRPAFALGPSMTILEAMRAAVGRQFPVYPVCDDLGRVVGLVRGQALFEQQIFTLSAQSGTAVGLSAQERITSPFFRSLRGRGSWLQLNLLLSLASAAVVSAYADAILRDVFLAVFLPIVAAQGRNSGAQTMAVVMRAINFGEWVEGRRTRVLFREMLVNAGTGLMVGTLGGLIVALHEMRMMGEIRYGLAGAVLAAMVLGSAASGVAAFFIPLALRRFGTDPAVASSILLSNTATFVCQSLFLAFAVILTHP